MSPEALIESYITWWKAVLGLSYWNIDVRWDETLPEGGSEAEVNWNEDYDAAHIIFNEEYPSWDPHKAEHVVVHELVHLATRDLFHVTELIFKALPVEAQQMAQDIHGHEIEKAVDRLALSLIAARYVSS